VVVEKAKLGGTCLHSGCIPTKALLHTAEVMDTAVAANHVARGGPRRTEALNANWLRTPHWAYATERQAPLLIPCANY
jgi:pyruvate/2-oxoglutarate dehydrogenase complex dihydrolipoamide dehydrogenase (E3) component